MATDNKAIVNPSRSLVQNARRTKALLSRPELLDKIGRRERWKSRETKPLNESERNEQNAYSKELLQNKIIGARAYGNRLREQKGERLDTNDIKKSVRLAKDATKIYSTLAPILPFVPVQFAFGIISLMGLASEAASTEFAFGFFNAVVPGMILYVAGLAVVILIGFCSLLYAVITLSLRGVNCFTNRRDLVLMLCVAAYIAPVLNLVPWVYVWGLYLLKPAK